MLTKTILLFFSTRSFTFYFKDWGPKLSHRFLGGYRLELDQTFTPLDRLTKVDEKKQLAQKLLDAAEISDKFEPFGHGRELMDSS